MTEPSVKLKRAWLVTWTGTLRVPENEIAAILNSRWGVRAVRDFVQQLYVATYFTDPTDKALFARDSKAFPCPVEVSQFGRIFCGMNPFLWARRVTNLTIVNRQATWEEPPSEDEMRKRLRDLGLIGARDDQIEN